MTRYRCSSKSQGRRQAAQALAFKRIISEVPSGMQLSTAADRHCEAALQNRRISVTKDRDGYLLRVLTRDHRSLGL
jgi:hypothetical protein